MRHILILSFISCALSLSAQKDIELHEREENGKTILYATNTSKTDFELTVNIESNGVDLSQQIPYTHLLKAGKTEDLIILTPRPGQAWSYNTSVSFKAVMDPAALTQEPDDTPTDNLPQLSAPVQEEEMAPVEMKGLVLFTKPGCGRCVVAKDHLKSLKVKFTEIDINKSSPEVNAMWSGVRRQGLKGNRVMTPVIAKDGVYYHEIPDLRKFLDELVSGAN